MADENIINSGRDDAGKFVSKQVIQQAAQRALSKANAEINKTAAQLNKLKGAYAAIQKQLTGVAGAQSKAWASASKQFAKATADQQKTAARFYASMEKMRQAEIKANAKMMNAQISAYRKLANEKIKQAKAGSKGSGGGGGMSLGLGSLAGIVSVAAIVASTKSMMDYVKDLAWTRSKAQAYGGTYRNVLNELPQQRDAELYGKFAEQNQTNRYSGPDAIKGLLELRNTLQKSLGEQFGSELTLKLTESLKGSRAELQQFLTLAQTNVPQALRIFQSADISAFTTALAAATQKTDELGQTAFTLEQAWRDVKDSFETFTKDFVKNNSVQLKTVIQDIAQGFVSAINWGRQWAADMKPVFDFILGGFAVVRDAWDFWSGKSSEIAGQTKADNQRVLELGAQAQTKMLLADAAKAKGDMVKYNQLMSEAKDLNKQQQKISLGTNKRLNPNRIEPLKLNLSNPVEKVKLDTDNAKSATDKAADSAKKWADNLNKVVSPVEKATLAISDYDEKLSEASATMKRDMSRLQMLESSPLGFGRSMQTTVQAVKDADKELDLLVGKLQEQQSIVAMNEKNGRDAREDRIKALTIESEINDRLAARNGLLKNMQRGYLDAVGAFAMGAGKFEKFIVTQDQNIRRGLSLGMVKNNPLIGGNTGPSVSKPFQFSTNMDANLSNAMDYESELRNTFKGALTGALQNIVIPMPSQIQSTLAGTMMSRPDISAGGNTSSGSSPSSGGIPNRATDKLVRAGEMLISAGQELKDSDSGTSSGKRVSM